LNDEVERIWKEAVVAGLRYSPGICPEINKSNYKLKFSNTSFEKVQQ
jgi:hypothetical protein